MRLSCRSAICVAVAAFSGSRRLDGARIVTHSDFVMGPIVQGAFDDWNSFFSCARAGQRSSRAAEATPEHRRNFTRDMLRIEHAGAWTVGLPRPRL